MTTQLALYNGALGHLGESELGALTGDDDEGQARRSLDSVWQSGLFKDRVLIQGHWNFATRTTAIENTPSITVSFGYAYAFDKPTDWLKTSAISGDPRFNTMLDYDDKGEYWFADPSTIYVKYVSKDDEYGYDLSIWTESFVAFVEAHLAWRVAMPITKNPKLRDDMWALQKRLLSEARTVDGANEAVAYPPAGSWSTSRVGNRGGSSYGRRRY